MRIEDKLSILANAAKYDVSCASSGSRRKNVGNRLGNAAPCGICHTYTEDGRCVSLLKILFTNFCIYDCAYCVNRVGNEIPRAAFTSEEIVSLTIDFYRRNYIEGLFLSSGIMGSPDETLERLVHTAKNLRKQGFNGYIHLKCVPYASRRLIQQAGLWADRLSVNIELPSEESLERLTRNKTYASILEPMGMVRETIAETRADRRRMRYVPPFAPAGQSTQLIIGASPETDHDILTLADRLYRTQALKRIYYSAYVPVGPPVNSLPNIVEPPLRRENRLYQADWLMRLYGFALKDLISSESPFLDLKIDPKMAFALGHPTLFPVDVNTADREMILKVPGVGLKSTNRIVGLRRKGRIRLEHLKQLGVVVSRAQPFIRCDGSPATHWRGGSFERSAPDMKPRANRKMVGASSQPEARPIFLTDGTFEGLLTSLFESFTTRRPPIAVKAAGEQLEIFQKYVTITTDTEKSDRVWRGLKKHLGREGRRKIFEAHLSRQPDVETLIYRFVRSAISVRNSSKNDEDLSASILVAKIARKVRREAHRMKGFIRFQQTAEGRYLALIAPRYDVLPLIRRHFELRFSDQHWTIYDTMRKYGLHYDRRKTLEVRVGSFGEVALADETTEEQLYRALWQTYYAAVNIPQRNNPKLHLRQLPRRYWQYLTEKKT